MFRPFPVSVYQAMRSTGHIEQFYGIVVDQGVRSNFHSERRLTEAGSGIISTLAWGARVRGFQSIFSP